MDFNLTLIFYITLAVMSGMMLPTQGAINANLSHFLYHPTQAAWISFVGGLICMTILTVSMGYALPKWSMATQIPWYLWIGGLMGVVGVTSYIVLTPKIGVTSMMASALAGQMILAIIIDHNGWFDTPVNKISPLRILGVLSLFGGVYLAKRK